MNKIPLLQKKKLLRYLSPFNKILIRLCTARLMPPYMLLLMNTSFMQTGTCHSLSVLDERIALWELDILFDNGNQDIDSHC